MTFDAPAIAALAQRCAPEIATEALVPLVLTESGGDPLRINVNRGPRVRANSPVEGAMIVRRYVAAGYTVDVGLAQINSATLARLGSAVEQAFEPCANLRLASLVLQRDYGVASLSYAGLGAISATYSLYNTGSPTRGLRDGYVGRVWSAAAALGSIATPAVPLRPRSAPKSAPRPDWVLGQLAPRDVEIFK